MSRTQGSRNAQFTERRQALVAKARDRLSLQTGEAPSFRELALASGVSVAYGVYKSDATNGKTATFSLYCSQDQGGTWTKVGSSVTASSNTLSTATFSGLNLVGPVRFKLAVEGTPTARLNLDDFRIQ